MFLFCTKRANENIAPNGIVGATYYRWRPFSPKKRPPAAFLGKNQLSNYAADA